MDETMARIHKLANERLDIYRLAGQQKMTPQLQTRLQTLNAELPTLWDQYRREFAAERWGNRSYRDAELKRAA